MNDPRIHAGVALLLVILAPCALAATSPPIYVAVDVPSRLGGVDYTPEQIVRDHADLYVLEAALPPGASVGAFYRYADGAWLFAPREPVDLDGFSTEPRDLVWWDGFTFSPWLDGEGYGLPAGVRIDALFVDQGLPVISIDTPANLGQVEYGRSDLIRLDGQGFSLFWSAAAAGVPASSNLVGAEIRESGQLLLAFDVPTDLQQTTYLAGQLVEWDGNGFSLFHSSPGWPPSARMRDFGLAPEAGAVVATGPGALRLERGPNGGGEVKLSWGGSCSGGNDDFVVYEGPLGQFDASYPHLCSTNGSTEVTIAPAQGARFFLVTSRNVLTEGSLGTDSDGKERKAGGQSCLPRAPGSCP